LTKELYMWFHAGKLSFRCTSLSYLFLAVITMLLHQFNHKKASGCPSIGKIYVKSPKPSTQAASKSLCVVKDLY